MNVFSLFPACAREDVWRGAFWRVMDAVIDLVASYTVGKTQLYNIVV